jgi:hypothetical protein
MKSCPTCNRTYPDDTLAFCLVDGSILSAPYDPQTTRPQSYSPHTEPPPTEILYPTNKATDTIPSLSSQPIFIPETQQNHPSKKRSRKRGLIAGVIALLMLTVAVILAAGWRKWFGSDNSLAKQSNVESADNNTMPKTVPSATSSATPKSIPSPTNTPPLTKKIDVTGNWTGEFANRDAMLFINSQDGDSFSGTLRNSKGAVVAINGRINRDTRQISIQENRVVEDATEGNPWILGSNIGSLSADGKRMSGSGKDKVGHAYTWVFNK